MICNRPCHKPSLFRSAGVQNRLWLGTHGWGTGRVEVDSIEEEMPDGHKDDKGNVVACHAG